MVFQPSPQQEWGKGEQQKEEVASPGIHHAEPVQRLGDINEVVMSQREEIAEGFDKGIEAQIGEGEAADADAENPPEAGDTHGHTQGGQYGEDEDAESLCRNDGEHGGGEHGQDAAVARIAENEIKNHVYHHSDKGEDEGIGEHLCRQCQY